VLTCSLGETSFLGWRSRRRPIDATEFYTLNQNEHPVGYLSISGCGAPDCGDPVADIPIQGSLKREEPLMDPYHSKRPVNAGSYDYRQT
jgi:hypothetical protein